MPEDLFSSFPDHTNIFIQGASRGLGLAFVQAALTSDRIAHVFATSRDPEHAAPLLNLKAKYPHRLITQALDLTDESSIQRAADAFRKLNLPLHLILNVAGILHAESRGMMPEKKLDDLRPQDAIYAFQINALGPLLVARHFIEFLDPARAVIANLSARVGSIEDNKLGGWYSYRASKAAQNMFTRTLSIELGRYRKSHQAICVALHPGTVQTDLSAPFRSRVKPEKLFSPERAARQLLEIIDGLTPDDQGKFFAWDGQQIPF